MVAHLLPDAYGAVALYVAVPPDRAKPRAASPDLASKQREIDDALHVRHAVSVLGDPHGPAADHALRRARDLRRLVDEIARDAATGDDLVPWLAVEILDERAETFGVVLDEVGGENASATAVEREHLLHDALEQRDVPVDAYRQEEARDGSSASEQPQRLLRILEP